jgi:hypothetical protein
MKANGSKREGKGKALSFSLTAASTLACFRITKLKAKVFTLGKMVKYMTENGTWVRNKDLEYGRGAKGIPILESGLRVELKGMVSISGKMEIDMKVNG